MSNLLDIPVSPPEHSSSPQAPGNSLLAFAPCPTRPTELHRRTCSQCGALKFCLPEGLTAIEAEQFSSAVSHRMKIGKGSALFHAADPLVSLYAMRLGAFKTTLVDEGGRGQVTGFQMPGDILGLDAIADGRHTSSAVALEDSEVCVIAYAALQRLCASCPTLQHNFSRLLSQSIVREQQMLLVMGNLRAEQRLAAFLLNLSERFNEWGYSGSNFFLRMSREDISSYLGLRLETVCRCIAHLRQRGILACRGRAVEILDMNGLKIATRA